MPQRIQRKRTKGWKKPSDAIIVSRPSKYGNPYIVASVKRKEKKPTLFDVFYPTAQEAVDAYERMLAEWKWLMPDNFEAWIAPLRGRDLCCFCKVGDPCHGDILMKYANEGVENE